MILSPQEIIEALVMTGVVGWIFMDTFAPTRSPDEFLKHARNKSLWRDAWLFSALLVAPAIILHELGHKFVAMAFGLTATFNAAWTFLAIGVLMKLFMGFVFFVPAYVSIVGSAPAWVFALAAFAGPAVNFLLYGIAIVAPKIRKEARGKRLTQRELQYWALFAKINLFLGVFNLIPIPGFDGYQTIKALIAFFAG